eukprot:Ihof_evm12s16 gene=Ihof_evmTU12s16
MSHLGGKEGEKLLKEQEDALAKAASKSEEPPKTKHIRNAVITTWKHQSGTLFWTALLRMPLGTYPTTCYKALIIVHKLLHDGHPSVLPEIYRERDMFSRLGDIWHHQMSPFSALISNYTKFLVNKLEFHHSYQKLSGDLNTCLDDFNEVNYAPSYAYTFVVHVFDLHDKVIQFAASILQSLNLKLTQDQTDLRTYGLLAISWESRSLYFIEMQLMEILHKHLDSKTMESHMARLVEQWYKLKKLYFDINILKSLKGQVQLPELGEEPPAWTRIKRTKAPKPKPVEDKFKGFSSFEGAVSFGPSADLESELARLREQIRALLREIERLKNEIARLTALIEMNLAEEKDDKERAARIKEQLAKLEALMTEQANKIKELDESHESLSAKDANAKAAQNRFAKMNEMYQKLRNDHLALLKASAAQKNAFEESQRKAKEAEQQALSMQSEIDLLTNENQNLESMNKEMANKNTTMAEMRAKHEAEMAEKKKILEDSLAAAKAEAMAAARRLEEEMRKLSEELANQKRLRELARKEREDIYRELINGAVETSQAMLEKAVIKFDAEDDPDQAGRNIEDTIDSAETAKDVAADLAMIMSDFMKDISAGLDQSGLSSIHNFSTSMCALLHSAKGSLRMASDPQAIEHMRSACHDAIDKARSLLAGLTIEEGQNFPEKALLVDEKGEDMQASLCDLICIADTMIIRTVSDAEQLGGVLAGKMKWASETVAKSREQLDDLLVQVTAEQTGLQLNVNDSILAGSRALMDCMGLLVERANVVHTEIVDKGRGGSSAAHFYRQNHTWTEGLITGTEAVGTGAQSLVSAADKAVLGKESFDGLITAANEIMNSTSQLVGAAHMKADRGSKAQERLEGSSKDVKAATKELVKAAKNASEIMSRAKADDYTKSSDDFMKRAEMEKQIK